MSRRPNEGIQPIGKVGFGGCFRAAYDHGLSFFLKSQNFYGRNMNGPIYEFFVTPVVG